MYITKQSLLLLSITLYSQEYITVRVPRCVFGSAFVLVGLFLERFPHQFGRFRKQDFFLGDFPELQDYVRSFAKQQHDVVTATNCREKNFRMFV